MSEKAGKESQYSLAPPLGPNKRHDIHIKSKSNKLELVGELVD